MSSLGVRSPWLYLLLMKELLLTTITKSPEVINFGVIVGQKKQ